jgi:D-sedoheptulose 7-phosphate isomerase
MNMITIGMTGNQNNLMKDFSDYIFEVPSSITAKIQEIHLVLGHILCGLVEKELFASKE